MDDGTQSRARQPRRLGSTEDFKASLERLKNLAFTVICPKCKHEWNQLDGEVCYDCRREADEKLKKDAQARQKLVSVLGGQRALADFTFEAFKRTQDTQKVYIACKYFDPTRDNLYLWGKCGRGKTHLALAIAQALLMVGRRVDVVSQRELVNRFRMKTGFEELAEYNRLCDQDLLVIDDLGIAKGTEFMIEVLCEVLNKRFLRGLNGLVLTSNLSLDDLAQKIGDDRLSSRIAGMCKNYELKGPDWRLNKS